MSGVETVQCPKSRAENQVTVSLCSVSWAELTKRLCTLFSADKIFMTHLFPSQALFTHPHAREQGLLFEDRLGDPLLTSGLGTCIMLE